MAEAAIKHHVAVFAMGLRLALFGTFYPEYNFAGTSTTPLAYGLARQASVDHVTVYCQRGAVLPVSPPHNLKLIPCWRYDNPSSLVSAALRLVSSSSLYDAVLFNTIVTGYGRSAAANGVGLLLPTFVSRMSGHRPFVFLHNLVETQDVSKLGYDPHASTLQGVHLLEALLLRNSNPIVPLRSQAQVIETEFGIRASIQFLPFLESYLLAPEALERLTGVMEETESPSKVLLLGTWGPQKDLPGALGALDRVARTGRAFELTLAGGGNKHFPGYLDRLDWAPYSALRGHVRQLGELPDGKLFDLLFAHDLLVLPYRATGGYSGALNFAGATGLPVIAYRSPQLEEQVELLGTPTTLVTPDELVPALELALDTRRIRRVDRVEVLRLALAQTERALGVFAHRLTSIVAGVDSN